MACKRNFEKGLFFSDGMAFNALVETKEIEMNTAVAHYYKRFRNDHTPALAAWNSARSFVHFRESLSADVATHKKRSAAAKRAWKARRAAA